LTVQRIIVGTRNRKKLEEMTDLLRDLPVDVVSVDEVAADLPSPEETGETFEDNARLKALYFSNATGDICISDDSGIEIDHLGGAPGVYSSRWAGSDGDDDANNARLVESLDGVAESDRGAGYRCVIAVAGIGKILYTCQGECRGVILDKPRGDGGFGYDPYFYFPEFGLTFAEISREKKAAVSHRGKALRELQRNMEGLLSILENRKTR